MGKLSIVISFLIISVFHGSAQTKSSIQKGYAFVQIIMPGTRMADDNGTPGKPRLNISRFIYVEVKGKTKPAIEYAVYGNESFKVDIIPVTILPEQPGSKKGSDQKMILNAGNGNTLWRLELQSSDEDQIRKKPAPYKKIILKEIKNGKHFQFMIDHEIELISPMSV